MDVKYYNRNMKTRFKKEGSLISGTCFTITWNKLKNHLLRVNRADKLICRNCLDEKIYHTKQGCIVGEPGGGNCGCYNFSLRKELLGKITGFNIDKKGINVFTEGGSINAWRSRL